MIRCFVTHLMLCCSHGCLWWLSPVHRPPVPRVGRGGPGDRHPARWLWPPRRLTLYYRVALVTRPHAPAVTTTLTGVPTSPASGAEGERPPRPDCHRGARHTQPATTPRNPDSSRRGAPHPYTPPRGPARPRPLVEGDLHSDRLH